MSRETLESHQDILGWPGFLVFFFSFFADDLMLFANADRKNCIAIREILDFFYELSG